MGKKKEPKAGDQIAWMLLSSGAAWAARGAAQRMLHGGWKAALGRKPPKRASREASLATVLAWAATSAAVLAIVEILAEQGAAAGWRRVTGTKPPWK